MIINNEINNNGTSHSTSSSSSSSSSSSHDSSTGWWQVVNTPALYVFSEPTINSDNVGSLPTGTIIEEIDYKGDWIKHTLGWSLSFDFATNCTYLVEIEPPHNHPMLLLQQQPFNRTLRTSNTNIMMDEDRFGNIINNKSSSYQQIYKQSSMKIGSTPGIFFDDQQNSLVVSVYIRYGIYLDGIQFTYAGGQGKYHGGSGGQQSYFYLGNGEKIIQVNYRSGSCVDAIQFVTNFGNVSQWYGGTGGGFGTIYTGKGIVNVKGSCGSSVIDSLQFEFW